MQRTGTGGEAPAVRKEASRGERPRSAPSGETPAARSTPDWVASVRVNRSAVERRAARCRRGARSRRTGRRPGCCRPSRRSTSRRSPATTRRARCSGSAPRPASRCASDLLEALGRRRSAHPRRRGLRLSRAGARRPSRRCAGSGIPVAAVSTGFPAGHNPFELRVRGDRERRSTAGAREIDIVIIAACAPDRQLAGALRRGARLPRGLRPRPHEDDPRHRRARHAPQRGPGQPRVHDGGGRLHQDLDRQGGDERHAARQPRHGARHPRLPRAHRLHGSASSRRGASAPRSRRSTG